MGGKSVRFLARKNNVSHPYISSLLKREGVKVKSASDTIKLNVNERAFDEINEESAYWLGFLMADGCIRKREGNCL